MKKILKWTGILLGFVIVIGAVVLIVLVSKFNNRMEKNYTIAVEKLQIPADSASVSRGRAKWVHLCQSCHGEALQGKVFFTDPKIGTIYSPNLTKGKGGVGAFYTDEDWVRAIRHGLNPKGKALFVMPSKDLHMMSEKDLSELIAAVKAATPVDNEKGGNIIPMFTKVLMQVGAFGDVYSAELINHDEPFKPSPAEGPTAEYGNYLIHVFGCSTCHGPDYNGGKSPDPLSPVVPNLTPAGNMAKWTAGDFIKTMRLGVTPEHKALNDTFMPWKHIGQSSDDDLTAAFEYLKKLPSKPAPKI
jgi:mono/diheme cytochrome c family protein